ncbi:fatty acid desaturase 1-like [Trichoplusia ni]|uniref:Fatty acid desaturase 1-like n=1 Tax=Trichoplusia ni TaxID=7111 RepID=A0A7E5W7K0_TRINI|nr:fatty acid desaturase 1-like [Trichoplusia ni]
MKLLVFLVLGAVIAEAAATREATKLLGGGLQSFGQAAEQAKGQMTDNFPRSVEDFSQFTDKSKQSQRHFTRAEVSRCAGRGRSCLYIIYNKLVLDLTDFAKFHPGGSGLLSRYAGSDATAAMRATGMPPAVFDTLLQRFVIGTLVQD